MRNTHLAMLAGAALLAVFMSSTSIAQAPPPRPAPIMAPSLPPAHVVDLMTQPGVATFGGQWKVADVKIVEVAAIPNAMPQYKTTYNIEPKAGAADYDDSRWQTIDAKDLAARRGGGHVSFLWYRTSLTIPEKIGAFETSGAVAVLSVTVDDYAEVWIDGAIPGRSGYPSPATIQGHNMPQRVVLGTSVKGGDKFQIAIFGINGPISMAPANTVWFREAKLEFFK
jgi:gluconolactonase